MRLPPALNTVLCVMFLTACSSGQVGAASPRQQAPDAATGTMQGDAAQIVPDAGSPSDGMVMGMFDATLGPRDAGPDGSLDGGSVDGGRIDGGSIGDASLMDAGDPDASSADAGIADAGTVAPLVPRIVATPAPGTFVDAVNVTLSLVDVDASAPLTLFCTTDGSLPVAFVSSSCSSALALSASHAVRAIAVDGAGLTQLSFFGAYLKLDADVAAFSSSLPVLVFWSNEPVPQQKLTTYASFSLSVFDAPTGTRNQWPAAATDSVRAGIKIRGSSSADYLKRPWRVETWNELADNDDKLALLGMPADSDWALNAPLDFDRALMRNSLMFALSNAIGRYAPRTRFAEVFTVGEGGTVGLDDYVGVYEVTELIKRAKNRVAIKHLNPTDVSGAAVTGGYLFKEDRPGPGEAGFTAGTAGGAFAFVNPFVYEDPSESEIVDTQRLYLSQYLNDVGNSLVSPAFTDSRTGLPYGSLIDVDSFIDHHILNTFAKNPDAFRLSAFFSKDRDGLLVAGPIWDFDRTLGCVGDNRALDPTWWDPSNFTTDTTRFFDHGFFRGLFSDPVFRAAYWARFAELLDGPLSTAAIHARIDENTALLNEAAARNFVRWSGYPPRGSYTEEVGYLKTWISQRHDWIAGCLALPDPRTCTGN